jgi:O-antigen ligase
MENKFMNWLKNKGFNAYIIIVLFVMVFTSPATGNLSVLSINLAIDRIYIIVAILFLTTIVIGIISLKRYYIDVILILLYFRMLINLIPMLSGDYQHFWGNYLLIVADFFIYFIASQNSIHDFNKIIKIIYIYALIICAQVVVTYFHIGSIVNYFNLAYKSLMIVPIGASNYITCIILPILIALVGSSSLKNRNFLFLSILLVGIVLAKSRGAFIILIVFIIFALLEIFMKNIKHRKVINLIFMSLLLFGISIVLIQKVIPDYNMQLSELINGYSSIMNGEKGINSLSSGRVEIFNDTFSNFVESPIWGHGPSYSDDKSRSHNIVLDLLYQSGILGTLAFLLIIIYWFNKINKYRKNDESIKFSYWFCITMLIQSLVEINLLSAIGSDFLFFTIMGLSVARIRDFNTRIISNDSLNIIQIDSNKRY